MPQQKKQWVQSPGKTNKSGGQDSSGSKHHHKGALVKNPFPDKDLTTNSAVRNSSRKSSRMEGGDILDQYLNQGKKQDIPAVLNRQKKQQEVISREEQLK